MSRHAPSTPAAPSDHGTLNAGLEAFQTSPEFHGPVEDLDGHNCNDHFAHIYETSEEKFAAAVPFVRHGLDRGERVMYVVDESTEREVKAALRDGGIDVDAAREAGALSFHTVQETYLRNGAFDVDEMIDFYGETVAKATEEYAALRIVAEMTWIPDDDTPVEQFIEYEQKVNELFAETDSLAICQYNRDLFTPEAIRNVVRTHPHLIYDGAACHNFYYTPPEEFFSDDAPARENDRMLRTLRDRAAAKAQLQQREQFLQDLSGITADPTLSFEEKLDRLFELGCEQFGLGFGFLNRVDTDDDRLEIEYASDDHEHYEVGGELPLSETYCQAAVDIEAAASIADPVAEGYDDRLVYEEYGVEGYLGTYVPVEGGADRTLAFVPGEGSRVESFSEEDRTYLDLMRQWIGYELERRRREEFLRQCYEITADPDRGFEEKLHGLLDLARDWIGLEAAGLTHFPEWEDTFLTEYAIGYGGDGVVTAADDVWTDPGEGCYCRQVIESDEPVGKADVRDTPWEDDEIHREHGLSCYLGTKITNGSTPYGTLWVGSTEPRDRAFTDGERTLLELMGQWVSYEIERRDHHEAQRNLYRITSDPDREFEEKLDALLDLGRERVGLDVGGIAKIDPETDYFEVETVRGDHDRLVAGAEYPLSETYCRLVTEGGETAAVTDPIDAGFEGQLCYERFGVQSYVGTHLEIDGGTDRTFWFLSTDQRDGRITDEERTFVDLMGEWVQYELERRQRERELRERTEHLNALIETTPECIKQVAPDGTLLQMNAAGLEMVEAPEESAVAGENVYDLIAPEDRERFREFNERICAGERGTLEFDIIGLEGTRRHMETHAAPLERPDGTTTHVALTRDVTEQKERKAELERALDLLAKTEQIADVGGWEIDPETHEVFWTDHLYELKDADGDAEPPLDETIEMYHEDDQPVIEDAVEAALDTGESFDLEVRLQPTASDDVRWLHLQGVPETENGEVVSIRGAAQDITEQKERKRALRESKEQLRALIDVLPVAVFVAETDGEIVEWNEAAEEIWGGEVVESESIAEYAEYDGWWADTGEPVDPEEWAMARALRGEEVTDPDEIEIEGFDGERRTVLNYGMPVRDADGEVSRAVVTLVDITERKERQRELAASEHRYRGLAENFPNGGVGVYDEDLRYTLVTGTMWDDIDPDAADLEGETIWECLPPDTAADVEPLFRAALDGETGSVVSTLGGRIYRVWATPLRDADGEITGGQSFALDITEREEREAELRQTKERFEAVFEQSDDGIFVLDPDADELVDANPAAAEMTGYTREELLSLAPSDLHPGEREEFHAFLEEVQEQGSAWNEDLHCRHKDGHDIPAEITASPITLDGRDLVLASVRHIEERKKHERYQRELYEIIADTETSFDEKLDRLLELGRERFGLENGYFNRIDTDADEFEVVAAVGPHDMIEPGAVDSLTGTYCGVHLDTADPLPVTDASDAGLDDLRACTEYELDAYFAATVHVDSEEYGTLCFASETPRDKPFTDAERTFLDLMSQWMSYEFERREHNQSQRELYEITANPDLDTDEKIDRLLAVGCDRLNLPVGMLTRDRGDAFEIEHMHGTHPDLDEGVRTPPLTDNYCRQVVNTGESVDVSDTEAAGWDEDALYHGFNLQSYAGTQVTVSDTAYGTLCFTDTQPRQREFTETEQAFLDLMGQCVSYELERTTREERLHTLNTLGRELLDTETATEVADRAVEIIDDMADNRAMIIALYDEETGDLRPAAETETAADLPTETLLARSDGIGWDAFVSSDTQRMTAPFDAVDIAESAVSEVVVYPLGNHGVVIAGSTRPEGFDHDTVEAMQTAVANLRAAIDRAAREQQLQEREDTLEEQNETLARLNRINDTIRSVDQALVEATTRDEIERVVCEELADTGPYELAWLGERDDATDDVHPRASAGGDKGYLEGITVTADDAPEGCGPIGRAVKTGDPQVVNDVLTDESFEPWRQDALNRGYHAVAAFPLSYKDTQYGVLAVYAGQPDVFDDLEREVLAELSATIGHAINAIESKKGLVGNTVEELEFEVTDETLEVVAMARDLECAFELKRLVPRTDGGIRAFFTVDGASTEDVFGCESALPTEALRVVSEPDDESPCLFEAELTDGSLGQLVTDHGGQLSQVRVEDGVATVVVRLAADANTREFVEMFQSTYPESELVANRTRQLSEQTPLEFAASLTEELTDRQLEALQTAYFSSYFDSPREMNGSEIADLMGLSQPTFNSHVRRALNKLCRRIFEDEMAAVDGAEAG